uniref:Uncharacterized protein n=1 Tax=Panagrolaimus sp. JU765 TaxID=591449 RepID=A0AC34RMU1_9BILA
MNSRSKFQGNVQTTSGLIVVPSKKSQGSPIGRRSVPQTPSNKKPSFNRQTSSQPDAFIKHQNFMDVSIPLNDVTPRKSCSRSPKQSSPTKIEVSPKRQTTPKNTFGHRPFAAAKYLETPPTTDLPIPPHWMLNDPLCEPAQSVSVPTSPTTTKMLEFAVAHGFDGSILFGQELYKRFLCAFFYSRNLQNSAKSHKLPVVWIFI